MLLRIFYFVTFLFNNFLWGYLIVNTALRLNSNNSYYEKIVNLLCNHNGRLWLQQ